jgi:nucleotide-binding universal stress UspA family protein
MGYNKILIPLDGSEVSEKALQHLAKVANLDTEVHLLKVVPEDRVDELATVAAVLSQSVVSPGKQVKLSSTKQEEIRADQIYLNRIADELKDAGYRVVTELWPGQAISAIRTKCCEGFDLVLMATHRRTGLSKLLHGSVSEGVLHGAECPILIV